MKSFFFSFLVDSSFECVRNGEGESRDVDVNVDEVVRWGRFVDVVVRLDKKIPHEKNCKEHKTKSQAGPSKKGQK